MPIFDSLRGIGGKLGLIRMVSTTATAPPEKVPTRVVTLKELMAEVRGEQVRALADSPAELARTFAQVYEAAGIVAPEHGWTVERLQEFLRAEGRAALPRAEVQKQILQALTAQQAHVHEVVKDAVARDKALDEFELFVRAKLDARAQMRRQKQAEIASRIRELQAEADRLEAEIRADESNWKDWHARKVAAEKEMARAVGYLVDDKVVSVDE